MGNTILANSVSIVVVMNTTSNVSITLPTDPVNGQTINVKDGSGNLSFGNVVMTLVGTIDMGTNFVIDRPYNSATLVWLNSSWWII
jgi:hypothetical protein